MRYIGRFAPSPTGDLHFGSLVTALASYLDARHHQGQWLVRIDDIDQFRIQPQATEHILATLRLFGLQWDKEVYHQNQQLEIYKERLAWLTEQHLTYPCLCSRSEILKISPSGIYLGTCKDWGIDLNQPHSIRLKVAGEISFVDRVQGLFKQSLATSVGDFIIQRKDHIFAYQLITVIDDAIQGITHIVRGEDLLDSTPRQIYLQHCFNYPQIHYAHIPLVKDQRGYKLSKQNKSAPLDKSNPVKTLKQALAFLNQPIPKTDSIPILLAQATQKWNLQNVNKA